MRYCERNAAYHSRMAPLASNDRLPGRHHLYVVGHILEQPFGLQQAGIGQPLDDTLRDPTSARHARFVLVVRDRLPKEDLTDATLIHPGQETAFGEAHVPMPCLGLGFIGLR